MPVDFPQLDDVRARRVSLAENIARLKDELSGINAKLENKQGSANLRERGANLIAGISRLEGEDEELQSKESDLVLTQAAADKAMRAGALESGDGAGPAYGTSRSNIGGVRGEGLRAIQNSDLLPDHAKENATRIIEDEDDRQALPAARWAQATASADYASAFRKVLQHGPVNAPLTMDDRERAAFGHAMQIKNALQIGTDADGGFLVPAHLDPAVLLTSDGSINPLRQISRVERIATDTWNGVSSAGVTAEWLAEGLEAADASPTFGQPSVPVHKGSAFVPFSFEWAGDARNGEQELAGLLTDAADQLQATAYTTGSGTGQPTGLITALPAGSEVSPATAEVFAAADVYATIEAVPPRFRPRARWVAELSTINEIDQFETANGSKQFPRVGDVDPVLLQRRLYENSNMRGHSDIDPAVTEDNKILVAGDFREFLIVDRVGSTLEIIQNLFGANNRPTGQRGAFLWFRTGSDVLVDEAFRVLNVATTL